MPKAASSRTPLPALSSDFALPSSTASPTSASDDHPFLYNRFRRPSLLQKAGYLSETRLLSSPLATSFTFHARRRSQTVDMEENERDRMLTDSSSSSETHTPPLKVEGSEEDTPTARPLLLKPPPLTPPRRKPSMDVADMPTIFNRRLSFPLKQPRVLTLLAQESRPEEAEVKSEAAFQRLVASVSELPMQPRTPRPSIDRGRYPEEAGQEEEITRADSPSDDDEEPVAEVKEEGAFAFSLPPTGTQPINIQRPASRNITPAASMAGSMTGDDIGMSISETSSCFAMAMDIDMPLGSPLLPSLNQWRHTPPPTSSTSAMRSNKRKRSIDDRFDPYPSASKRRAVSPSISYLRDSHSSTSSPITRASSSRHPIAIPIAIPPSAVSSATSSPTLSSYPPFPRGLSITSSPTLRATLTMASPILRPLGSRRRLGEGEEREIQGAGEAVNGLTLESTLQPESTVGTLSLPAGRASK